MAKNTKHNFRTIRPVFLVALLLVRGVPALPYRSYLGGRLACVAGLLQATTLTFVVVAPQVGVELGTIDAATGAALVAAALVSVVCFPLAALTLLRGETPSPAPGLDGPVVMGDT